MNFVPAPKGSGGQAPDRTKMPQALLMERLGRQRMRGGLRPRRTGSCPRRTGGRQNRRAHRPTGCRGRCPRQGRRRPRHKYSRRDHRQTFSYKRPAFRSDLRRSAPAGGRGQASGSKSLAGRRQMGQVKSSGRVSDS